MSEITSAVLDKAIADLKLQLDAGITKWSDGSPLLTDYIALVVLRELSGEVAAIRSQVNHLTWTSKTK